MRLIALALLSSCGLDPLSDGPSETDDSGTDAGNVLMIGDLQVSPGSVDFGDVQIDASSSLDVVLTNQGSGTVSLSSAYLDGDTAYSLTALGTPLDLSSGDEAVLVLDFAPDAEQTYTGTLNLLVSGEADFAIIDITGIGSITGSTGGDSGDTEDPGSGSISLSTGNISFGVVDIGNVASEVVTVTNTGNVDVMLQDIATTAAGIVEGDLETPALLSAGDSRTFSVNYAPVAEANTTAILTVENDSGEAPEIVVSGEGYQNCTICMPVLGVMTGGTDNTTMNQFNSLFGSADDHTLTLQNNGDVALEITDIAIENDSAAPGSLICGTDGSYRLTGGFSGVTIDAYSSSSVTVSFTFSGSGACGEVSVYPLNNENTLTISSNDPTNAEHVIILGGTGLGI